MLDKLINYFLKFPGIGPRQAKRFAYFLAEQDEKFIKDLSGEISDIKNKIKQCPECFRFFEGEKCSVCSGLNRDKNILMIVEKDVDLENIEKAGDPGLRGTARSLKNEPGYCNRGEHVANHRNRIRRE